MKRLLWLLPVFLLETNSLKSQVNLVTDPSFEIFSSCPNSELQIELSSGWDTLRNGGGGLPALLTKCCQYLNGCSVPYNLGFHQGFQYPRTDSSYGSWGVYQNSSFIAREYIQNKLNQKLIAGKSYCLKYYINLNNVSEYAIDQIGAYFDDGTISCPPWGISTVVPQIITPVGIYYNDTLNWVQISGVYTANGSEQYLTLGNFKTNANTDTLNFNPSAPRLIAEYNIDDVSLISTDVTAWAHNDTTICAGDSLMLGRIPEIGLDCIWTDTVGHVLGNKANLWVKPTVSQKYIVRMDNCVTTYDTVTITVKPRISKLIVSSNKNPVCSDSTVQLSASVTGGGTGLTWQWLPSFGLTAPNNPVTNALIQQNQTYVLTLTSNATYCPPNSLSDSIRIKADDCPPIIFVTLPNIFTPNGDGVNDTWQPLFNNSSAITSYRCTIFDRWGVKLFDTDKPLQSWDGRDQTGIACIDGVYYYVMHATGSDSKSYDRNGFFQLIR